MKKIILASSIIAAASFTQFSQAADTGTINFTGTLSAATCTLSNSGVVDMNLNTVPFDAMPEATATSATADASEDFIVSCDETTGLASAQVKLIPDLDVTTTKLLKASGTGTGAGIALLKDSGEIIDLANPANHLLTENFSTASGAGTATFKLNAAFVKNGGTEAPGDVTATLPFEITYQ